MVKTGEDGEDGGVKGEDGFRKLCKNYFPAGSFLSHIIPKGEDGEDTVKTKKQGRLHHINPHYKAIFCIGVKTVKTLSIE